MTAEIRSTQPEAPERTATVDLSIYGIDAAMRAAHKFTGRCFVALQTAGDNILEVRLRPKRLDDDADALIGDFLNELLDQKLRAVISAETAHARDLVMAHALSLTGFIRPDLETAEPGLDPQNIATPDRDRTLPTPVTSQAGSGAQEHRTHGIEQP